MIIEVEQLTKKESKEFPNLMDTIKEYFNYLSEDEHLKIASIAVSVCGHCHDANRSCQCWNDE